MVKIINKKDTKTQLHKTAQKCIKVVDNTDNPIYCYREALVHKLCNMSPFLPKTFSVNIKDSKLTIEMEKLEKRLKNPTPEAQVKSWKNVLQAVALLNFFKIAHRDIKSENIMYRNGEEAVLIDFGLSKTLGNDRNGFHTPEVIAEFYRPPELDVELEVQQYGFEIDSWSLGILALETWNENFSHTDFLRDWKAGKYEHYLKNVPEKILKIVKSFLLPAGERKVALDWVNIDSHKTLYTFPANLEVAIPPQFKEWEPIFKSIYWSMKEYFKKDDNLIPMCMTACCNLVCPVMHISDIAEEYKIDEELLDKKVLEWFVQWKINKAK